MTLAVPLDQLTNFKMPTVSEGTVVLYYPAGLKTARKPEVGVVIRTAERSIVLSLFANGTRMDTVRHVNDPKLQLNADQREGGAWDFTDEHYSHAEWVAEVSDKLNQLMSEAKPKKPTPKKTGKSFSAYRDLRKQAAELGIQFSGNPSKVWLEEQIKGVTDGEAASTEGDLHDMVGEDRAS